MFGSQHVGLRVVMGFFLPRVLWEKREREEEGQACRPAGGTVHYALQGSCRQATGHRSSPHSFASLSAFQSRRRPPLILLLLSRTGVFSSAHFFFLLEEERRGVKDLETSREVS